MEGELFRHEDNYWAIRYDPDFTINVYEYQLHPDDVETANKMYKDYMDGIESRFNGYPYVEFEIVEHQKMSGSATYAKLTH